MDKSEKYLPLETFVFRVPLYNLDDLYRDQFSTLSSKIQDSRFLESLYLASSVLYQETDKSEERMLNWKDFTKIQISNFQYLTRMCSRCTPFGLFAGCGICGVDQKSSIELADIDEYKSSTRLDMGYLSALIQDIINTENIKSQSRYYPNSSLYRFGKDLRYIEYNFFKAKRKYSLSQTEQTEYLQKVLQKSEDGETINILANLLVNEDISNKDAREYIDNLIDNQILINELEPSVTGDELLKNFIVKLKEFNGTEEIVSALTNIETSLQNIDNKSIGRPIPQYEIIKKQLDQFETNYDEMSLFQSDLFIATKQASISKTIISTTYQAIKAFNRLSIQHENPLLVKFREDFYKKYDNEEIPLLQALDVETGIGFGKIDEQSGDISPLLDGVFLTNKQSIIQDIKVTPVQQMLLKKFDDFLTDRQKKEIIITDKDLEQFPENWNDLPDTISAMIEVIQTEKNPEGPLIVLGQAGGSSAANLLGRFCYLDEEIYNHVKRITQKEQELNPTKILAEIVHLPEFRTGNILMRPIFREYEIPYLANPSVKNCKVIPMTDLMVSVPQGRYIKLRSKRLNKEVLPRLSSAHNFANSSLPVYHFLCTMQTQGLRSRIGFSWGSLLENKPFLPRVRYRNIIFSPAIWNIVPDDTKEFPKITDRHFYEKALLFKTEKVLPDQVLLVQGDNKLLIDFRNELSVQMLFSKVKKNPFRLEEFLFDTQYPMVKRRDKVFTNQVILCFYKNKK